MVQKLLYLPPLASAHGAALDRMTLLGARADAGAVRRLEHLLRVSC